MVSTEKVLKARLVVSDEFGSTLAKFTQSLSNTEKVDENKLANNIFGIFTNSFKTSFLNSSN